MKDEIKKDAEMRMKLHQMQMQKNKMHQTQAETESESEWRGWGSMRDKIEKLQLWFLRRFCFENF